MAKIKAVLFDFDGTLMDTNQLILDSWYHVFDTYGMDRLPKEKITPTFGRELGASLKEFFPDHPEEETVRIYRSFQQQIFKDRVRLFDGMPELLEALISRGLRLAVVTSRLWQTLHNNSYDFKEEPLFEVIVSGEDITIPKPSPQPCQIALERLGIGPDEAIMIGDSAYDTLCARNAGVRSVLVGWSLACPPAAAKGTDYEPDYVIEKASDLLTLLDQIERGE
ncbi:MAG: HAD-IA family hydrolase [Firmicutes bacterium]|nr:HAD-IA family hydrolase [Bacillota bacterium]